MFLMMNLQYKSYLPSTLLKTRMNMKKYLHLILMTSAFAFSSYAHASKTGEPKDVLAQFHAALVKGDAAQVKLVLSPKVTIYEAGYVERSREEYESHHMAGDMKFAKESTQKVVKHTERTEGNVSIIWQETETKANIKGQDVTILGATTALLEKTGSTWQITHVHWSSRKPIQKQ